MASQSGGFFQLTEIEQQRSLAGKRYLEFLRVPALSAGLYVLPAEDAVFVAAGVEHRFCEIKEELAVLVFFAPAESA